MREIKIHIPDTLDLNDRDAKFLLASKLYELGKLSLGQAAEMVGLSKSTFIEILVKYGVPVLNYPPSEIDNDLKDARDHSI